LKKNYKGKFNHTSLENDFFNFAPPSFLEFENGRWLDFIGNTISQLKFIDLYKQDNHYKQPFWHVKYYQTIVIHRPKYIRRPKVLLKNLSGFLELSGTAVTLIKFEKQNDGKYKKIEIRGFKKNVKEIISKDFEHYAEDVQFILFEN